MKKHYVYLTSDVLLIINLGAFDQDGQGISLEYL